MQTHRIEIPERFGCRPGAHVLIRDRESWALRNRLQTAGIIVRSRAGERVAEGEPVQSSVDAAERGLVYLEGAVISWEGVTDSEGKPLPANRAGFLHDDFDPDLGDFIVERIDARYAAQRAERAEGKAIAASGSSEP